MSSVRQFGGLGITAALLVALAGLLLAGLAGCARSGREGGPASDLVRGGQNDEAVTRPKEKAGDGAVSARLDHGAATTGWGLSPVSSHWGDHLNPLIAPAGATAGTGTVIIIGEIPR